MSSRLKILRIEWYRKLKESGFDDIEDLRGNLKQHNLRTIAFQNRDSISDFFTSLGEFLEVNWDIPELHRKILEFYCRGMHLKAIGEKVNRTSRTVSDIIAIYKKKLLR